MYLRCGRCTICIGPGFHFDEIWFDPTVGKRVCRACAEVYGQSQAKLIVTSSELRESGGGSALITLLKERETDVGHACPGPG